ncbi:MAG: hypothetical protein FWG09_06715, partial [Synergistaceae bacterium]|nr:hypothetical protein [Synergistaceae bacterium]
PAGAGHTNGVGTFEGVTAATATNPNGYYAGTGTCSHVFMYGSPVGNARAGTYLYDFPPPPGTAGAYYEPYNYPTIRKVAAYGMDIGDISVADDYASIIKMFGGDPDTFDPATSTLFDDIPNANIIFEVVAIHDVEEAVTFKVTSKRFDKFANPLPDIESFITIGKRGISGGVMDGGVVTVHDVGIYSVGLFDALGINILPDAIKLNKDFDDFSVGDSFHLNITPPIGQPSSATNYPSMPLRIRYFAGNDTSSANPAGNGDYELFYVFDKSFQTGHLAIPFLMIDTNNGDIYNANLRTYFNTLPFPHNTSATSGVSLNRKFIVGTGSLPDITNQQINIDVAMEIVYEFGRKYRTLGETYTNVMSFPQTLTLHQGESSATIVLYENDTFYDFAKKLNYAIAFGLQNAQYVKDSISNFAVVADGTKNTSEAAATWGPSPTGRGYIWSYESTIVIRSAVPGQDGIIHFSGDEEFLKAMGLNVIQQAEESIFSMSVSNAHDGSLIASNIKVTGNYAVGVVNENIDLYFDPMKNMEVFWNGVAKRFDFRGKSSEETLHVAYNAAVLQIGANEKEELRIAFADVSSRALGLSNILLLNNKLSERAVTKIDRAIDKVSSARANLGAYTNRLEHTITNLTVAQENLASSESRIRDLDMAQELMRLAKLTILVNTGNSMLTQANQLPQGILSLIR